MPEVTQLLKRIQNGEPCAAADLLPLVYAELRQLAAARLKREPGGLTLQGTALVHEAYLRLVGADGTGPDWDGRGHFFAAAAEAMRRILVENARQKQALRNGGEFQRVPLHDVPDVETQRDDEILELDAALTRLGQLDRTAAELIQLRYFTGAPMSEAAALLGLTVRSAERLQAFAKAWLHRELRGSADSF